MAIRGWQRGDLAQEPMTDRITRNREAARRVRAKQRAKGRRQINVNLPDDAIEALDALSESLGLDRSRALEALLLGHVQAHKPRPAKKSQAIELTDLFGLDDD